MVKNPLANAGDVRDVGLFPGLGRSPGGGHGNLLQNSCLENPMDRGAWRAAVHGITKSRTRLSEGKKKKKDWLVSYLRPVEVAFIINFGADLSFCQARHPSIHPSIHPSTHPPTHPSIPFYFYFLNFNNLEVFPIQLVHLFIYFGCAVWHLDLSSPTGDWTHAPCSGSAES